MKSNVIARALLAAVLLGSPYLLSAEVINFETFTGPALFGGPVQTLNIATSIGTVTFSGGVVLTQEANLPADQTSVYGTADFGRSFGYQNPITIVFPKPITNFFLDIYNGNTQPTEYQVSDNIGNSATRVLTDNFSGGQSLVGFAATGNVVTILANSSSNDIAFDFSIDNVTFNEPLPPNVTPEPASILLSSLGFLAVGATGFRRRLTAYFHQPVSR